MFSAHQRLALVQLNAAEVTEPKLENETSCQQQRNSVVGRQQRQHGHLHDVARVLAGAGDERGDRHATTTSRARPRGALLRLLLLLLLLLELVLLVHLQQPQQAGGKVALAALHRLRHHGVADVARRCRQHVQTLETVRAPPVVQDGTAHIS